MQLFLYPNKIFFPFHNCTLDFIFLLFSYDTHKINRIEEQISLFNERKSHHSYFNDQSTKIIVNRSFQLNRKSMKCVHFRAGINKSELHHNHPRLFFYVREWLNLFYVHIKNMKHIQIFEENCKYCFISRHGYVPNLFNIYFVEMKTV